MPTWANDQASLQVAAGDQFLDEQAGHDRLAGTWVVSKQEAERLARQHGLVDRCDLMRQRIDDGGVDRQHRIEQVGEANALGLGDEAEESAIAVEAPGPALLDKVEAGLIVAIEQLVGYLARRRLVGELERLGAEPLDADHGNQGIGQDPTNGGIRLEVFKLSHLWVPSGSSGNGKSWTGSQNGPGRVEIFPVARFRSRVGRDAEPYCRASQRRGAWRWFCP